ncbi:MAG: hypothetical protein IJW53_05005 [Clostridia bacterium]|nr:hypothetical protein [Clostridia bacterium]
MKKAISIILLFSCCFALYSCNYTYHDLEKSSINEYIDLVNKSHIGHSDVEIDHPDFFLPSNAFLTDYAYSEGMYFWREDDMLRGLSTTSVRPDISFIYLRYEDETYTEAKAFMLEKIKSYGDKRYLYGDYVFYENANFIEFKKTRRFPEQFTMACYNDSNNTLIFIGMYSGTLRGGSCLEKRYLDDIDGNWISFLDTYYGEVYDFSK